MKIAIIGAGVSGLASIKSCLEEGLEPMCFEKGPAIGGLWKFSQEEGSNSIYESTVINTSKEMTCFSDFPAPRDFPPFMPHSIVIKYLQMYAGHFDLSKFIKFNTTVLDVRHSSNYKHTGQWKVVYQENANEAVEATFDSVMICNGHLSKPFNPDLKGLDLFEGRKIHSRCYKNQRGFEGKVVLVVGKYDTHTYSLKFASICEKCLPSISTHFIAGNHFFFH